MAQTYLSGKLELLDPLQPHEFLVPAKKINEGEDVDFWLTTYAYTDLMTFVLQLNASMFPRKTGASPGYREWHLGDVAILYSEPVQNLRTLVEKLEKMIEDAPPDTGPRRFGNVSFRKWHQIVEERIDALLEEHLPQQVLAFKSRITTSDEEASARGELKHYLLGSFGSAQRLDFGTGHEVSFLAFLGCIWKLGGFNHEEHGDSWGTEERGIVIGVIEPYVPSTSLSVHEHMDLIAVQILASHSATDTNIHPRTCWVTRSMGFRRSQLHLVYLWLCPTFTRYLLAFRYHPRRIHTRCSSPQ